MGQEEAVAEAREQILGLAGDPLLLAADQSPGSEIPAWENLNFHVWCVAPRAMRVAVFYLWLEVQETRSSAESQVVGDALLGFFEHYVLPVLRARAPAGHNQQL